MSKVSLILLCIAVMLSIASSASLREGKISGSERLNEPEISQCLRSRSCPVTFDFKPTCASDGRTYVNTRTIGCLNECLKPNEQLTIVSNWYCEKDAPQAVPISKL